MNSVLVGRQSPAVSSVPAYAVTDGDDACFLATGYGLTPDEWQHHVINGALGRRGDGRWSASRVGLSVPRQNGKNGAVEVLELYKMVALGRKVLHTAHEVKTARKAFLRLCSFFENERKFPELAEMVESIRKTNGQEAIVLTNGASCEFIARSKGSGRGFTVDDLVLDEAQELTEEALAALMPTLSAAPSRNPQTFICGTPPGPKDNGEVFARFREDGVEGKDERLAWFEWSADAAGRDLDDEQLWTDANPALGIRLDIETLRDERAAMDDLTFMRERLGMWTADETARIIPLEEWEACSDPNAVDTGESVAIAIDVSPGRDRASIAASGMSADGRPWIDVVETRQGIPDWVIERVVGICERQDVRSVVIDGYSPAASFIDLLKRRKVKVTVINAANMAAASAGFYDAVMTGQVTHYGQPALNLAVAQARKRRIGEAWGWSRKDVESDITPLVSATLALFGLTFTNVAKPRRRNKSRKVVVY